jgi:hypothetical protein
LDPSGEGHALVAGGSLCPRRSERADVHTHQDEKTPEHQSAVTGSSSSQADSTTVTTGMSANTYAVLEDDNVEHEDKDGANGDQVSDRSPGRGAIGECNGLADQGG